MNDLLNSMNHGNVLFHENLAFLRLKVVLAEEKKVPT